MASLKARAKVLHKVRVIDTHKEAEIAEPVFKYFAIVQEILLGCGYPRWAFINPDAIAPAQDTKEFSEGEDTAPANQVEMHQGFKHRVGKDRRSHIHHLVLPTGKAARDTAFSAEAVRLIEHETRVEEHQRLAAQQFVSHHGA